LERVEAAGEKKSTRWVPSVVAGSFWALVGGCGEGEGEEEGELEPDFSEADAECDE
jgi:hypothetical protein